MKAERKRRPAIWPAHTGRATPQAPQKKLPADKSAGSPK